MKRIHILYAAVSWTENNKAAIRLMVATSIKLKIWSAFSVGGCDTECWLMKREQCIICDRGSDTIFRRLIAKSEAANFTCGDSK